MNEIEARIASLERAVRRERTALGAVLVLLCAFLFLGARQATDPEHLEDIEFGTVTVRALRVLDDQGRLRVLLAEDTEDAQRRNRACGLVLYDTTGAERAGLGTFEDLSVVLGLDSPAGVGAPMRDRIGLVVSPDGASRVDLIDNTTSIAVRLVGDTGGGGGVEFFDYDLENREVEVTRLDHEGQSKQVLALDD